MGKGGRVFRLLNLCPAVVVSHVGLGDSIQSQASHKKKESPFEKKRTVKAGKMRNEG